MVNVCRHVVFVVAVCKDGWKGGMICKTLGCGGKVLLRSKVVDR